MMTRLHCIAAAIAGLALSATAQYKVENVPLPTDEYKTDQIDGLAFTPSGKPVICFPSGTVYVDDADGKN